MNHSKPTRSFERYLPMLDGPYPAKDGQLLLDLEPQPRGRRSSHSWLGISNETQKVLYFAGVSFVLLLLVLVVDITLAK